MNNISKVAEVHSDPEHAAVPGGLKGVVKLSCPEHINSLGEGLQVMPSDCTENTAGKALLFPSSFTMGTSAAAGTELGLGGVALPGMAQYSTLQLQTQC